MTSSIADVAAHAGVSVATVSRALRGLPNVAEATRKRVLRAASELDYVVNPNASRLAAGRNQAVGVVMPSADGWYFQNVLAGVQHVLSRRGYDMLLYFVPTPQAREGFLTQLPFRKRVDGLVLIEVPLTDPEQRMLAELDTALVSVGEGGPHFPVIKVDNRRGARLATQYLLDLGHRRVGLLSGPLDDPIRFRVATDRHAGWMDALTARGVGVDPTWVVHGEFGMEDGVVGMTTLLQQAPGLTAVFSMSDEMAIGAMQVLNDQRIRVPQDVSVIGFDGHHVGEYLGLTSVAQPMRLLGITAANDLVRSIGGASLVGFPKVLPISLVVRGTAAPPDRPNLS